MKQKLLVPPESWPNTLTSAVNRVLKETLDAVKQDSLDDLKLQSNPHLSVDKFEPTLALDRVGRMLTVDFTPPPSEDTGAIETEDYGHLHLCIAGGQLCWRLSSGESRVLLPIARIYTIQQFIRSWRYYKKHGFNSTPEVGVIQEPLEEEPNI